MRKFMDDLREGMYIQQTVEGLLADMEGKQLLIELTYAHGVLLLLLDQRMDPKVKEHIVVSFYRYRVRARASKRTSHKRRRYGMLRWLQV